jgi:hypothetical protein
MDFNLNSIEFLDSLANNWHLYEIKLFCLGIRYIFVFILSISTALPLS